MERPILRLGRPVVVAQAAPDVAGWGPYQFPRVERLADGLLHVTYHVEADSATAYGLPVGHAVSNDDGRSWQASGVPESPGGLLLPNGDRLLADSERSKPVGALALPRPVAAAHTSYVDYDYHRIQDLPPELHAAWPFLRWPAGGSGWVREWATVDAGSLAGLRSVTSDVFVTPFFEQDRVRVLADGSLRATLYAQPHLGPRDKVIRCYLVQVIRSTDGGRTWQQVSTIPYCPDPEADPQWDARDGFTEPELNDMPDGSLFCLLRTTDGNGIGPLYWVRSTDGGATWSRPRVFDDRGVWPQLLTLGCGVTLAAYGRPGLFLRATAHASGAEWDGRITVVEPGQPHTETCSYSDLIALGDRHALIVYSDFRHPNPQGRPCKTMLSRVVEIVSPGKR